MSRYERRLGSKSSSPRPGQAACKLPKNNNNVLSGFINIKEKEIPSNNQNAMSTNQNNMSTNQNNMSNNQNVMIEELQEESLDSSIKKVMNINDQLKKAMGKITDKNIRLIYGHEIRLNTIELNVECLNDIKCEKIINEQEKNENQQQLFNNSGKIVNIEENINKNTILLNEKIVKTHDELNLLEINFKEKNELLDKIIIENKENKEKQIQLEEILNNMKLLIKKNDDFVYKFKTHLQNYKNKINKEKKEKKDLKREKEIILNILKKVALKLESNDEIITEIDSLKLN